MNQPDLLKTLRAKAQHNIVIIVFLVLAIAGTILSTLPFHFIVGELVARITRNSFLVMSLIIPIIAGIGLNFGIVVGAMAGQIALILITYWGVNGIGGITLAFALATPIAVLFGWLTAGLFNRTKGQEMIAGLIVGFFANGVYQFIFLFLVGKVIPIAEGTPMLKPDGIGLRNTISMGSRHGEGIKYALDYIWRINLWVFILIAAGLALVWVGYKVVPALIAQKKLPSAPSAKNESALSITLSSINWGLLITTLVGIGISIFVLTSENKHVKLLANIKVPVVTWAIIAGLATFTTLIMKTKLGQDFRAIGQSQHIAAVSGIRVNKTRTVAVIISTVLASWGQIIFLQNIGTMNTYGSHMQVGMFAIAAILIGGASVSSAKIQHALIGTVLFHSVFIVSPTAGKTLFGDAQIGEFFRSFVVYGVIGVSLALHSWKRAKEKARLNLSD